MAIGLAAFCAGCLVGILLGVPPWQVPEERGRLVAPAGLSADDLRVPERRWDRPLGIPVVAAALQPTTIAGPGPGPDQAGGDVLDAAQWMARVADLTERLERSERRLFDYRQRAYADLRVGIQAWIEEDLAADPPGLGVGESERDVARQVKHVLLDLAAFEGIDDMQDLRARVSRWTVLELGRFLSHWHDQSAAEGRRDYVVRAQEIEAILGVPVYSASP